MNEIFAKGKTDDNKPEDVKAAEPAKPKKAPKPIPAAYIMKAVDNRVVAKED